MQKANIFILSEDRTFLTEDAIELILQVLSSTFEPANAPALNHILMKAGHESGKPVLNAHNNPVYLLGAMEESEYPVIIVAWDENEEGEPRPKFFVSPKELTILAQELEKNQDTDAWVTAIRVNKEIRAKEKGQ